MTDLRGYDVVMGKLFSHSLVAWSGLVAIMPLMMMPVLLGGITFQAVWQTTLTLLLTAGLSLAVGMMTSSLFRNGRWSITAALVLLGLLCFSSPVLLLIVSATETPALKVTLAPVANALFYVNPMITMGKASTALLQGPSVLPAPEWHWLFLTHVLLLMALLAAACYFTSHFWHERHARPWQVWQRLWYWVTYGPAWYRRRLRQKWFEPAPLVWLVLRPCWKQVVVWVTVLAPAGFFCCAGHYTAQFSRIFCSGWRPSPCSCSRWRWRWKRPKASSRKSARKKWNPCWSRLCEMRSLLKAIGGRYGPCLGSPRHFCCSFWES